jgi:hypothetical protein
MDYVSYYKVVGLVNCEIYLNHHKALPLLFFDPGFEFLGPVKFEVAILILL